MDRGKLREDVATLFAEHVRKVNRVVAAGLHESAAIEEAADAILKLIEDSRAPVSGAPVEVHKGEEGSSGAERAASPNASVGTAGAPPCQSEGGRS